MDDLKYGSPARNAMVTNVGLITSDGPHGPNIMAAEWTFQLSYDPGIIAVSVGPHKATHDNIKESKCFAVAIAAEDQNVLSSLAGGASGKKVKKIEYLKSLGFAFKNAEKIAVEIPEGSALEVECELMDMKTVGDHVVFTGKAVAVRYNGKKPIVYHEGKYWKVGGEVPKPSQEERDAMKKAMEKFAK